MIIFADGVDQSCPATEVGSETLHFIQHPGMNVCRCVIVRDIDIRNPKPEFGMRLVVPITTGVCFPVRPGMPTHLRPQKIVVLRLAIS